MSERLRYCFDLDGTLCDTKGMDYANAIPIKRRIDAVKKLHRQGHYIIVSTARNRTHIKLTHDQLTLWGIPHHELHVGRKVPADVYVDDRAVSDVAFFGAAA